MLLRSKARFEMTVADPTNRSIARKRIGIVALLHESNTFINRRTELEDFESSVLETGDAVLSTFRGTEHEVGGFIAELESSGDCDAVGVFAARTFPYGPISAECWTELIRRLTEAVRAAGPIDGWLVAPHGATVAESASDADGVWLAHLRHLVGRNIPVIGTLDLHANVSPLMVKSCQALLGYLTNPHLDQRKRGEQAARLMLRMLRGEIAPVSALVQLPMCANIERQATAETHCQRLSAIAEQELLETPGLLDVSLLYGFPYADVAEMGASVIAVADGNRETAQAAAARVAAEWWNSRHEFRGHLVSVSDAVQLVLDSSRRATEPAAIGLLDMGDNTGGGSPADGTILLHALVDANVYSIFCCLFDPLAVELAVKLGVGNTSVFDVGGKTDLMHGSPLWAEFTVQQISDGQFTDTLPRHGGYREYDQGKTAVIVGKNGTTIMLTSRRMAPLSLVQLTHLGIDPSAFNAVIIKGVHAPVAAYANACRQLVRVNTSGVTSADLQQFHFHHRRRPMFPWDLELSWEPNRV